MLNPLASLKMASTGFGRVFSVCQAVRLPKVFVTFALVLPSSGA